MRIKKINKQEILIVPPLNLIHLHFNNKKVIKFTVKNHLEINSFIIILILRNVKDKRKLKNILIKKRK